MRVPRTVDTLAALDEALGHAASVRESGDDAFRSALAAVTLRPKNLIGALNRDPMSADFRASQLRFYETLTKSGYDVAREETVFDRAHMLRWPFPYTTRSPTTVGDYLMAYGQIIREMNLPRGAHVLEMGSGYGPLTYQLASMGYRVTCTDISENLLDYVRTRCAGLPGIVDTIRCDMNTFANAGVYDAVVFFESFHHVLDHAGLLERIAANLDSRGILVFAGEPIVPDDSPIVPYPWGLRMDGLSLWAIRRQGWLELGFRVSYFADLLRRTGWIYTRVPSVSMHGTDIWICRRATPVAGINRPAQGELVQSWRASDSTIYTQCGVRDAEHGTLRSDGTAGYLAYGPYARIESGTYEIVWAGRSDGAATASLAEVACGGGQNVLREAAIAGDAGDGALARARFHINQAVDDVEFRLRVGARETVVLEGMDLYLVR
jgi:2-polyprenyl-3-methyl-5-hydroxy-6-metoxy-1,4-benzoquinol methylase